MNQKEKPYICNFCQSKCVKNRRQMKRWWWWGCKTCDVEFLVSINGLMSMIEFKTKEEKDHNYRFYSAHIDLQAKKTSIYVWTLFSFPVNEPNKKAEAYKMELIKKFDSVLDLTPKNMEHKIKTIVTFL